VAFSFPAHFGFGVTEFFKLSLSPLREFQLLFLQVAIHLPNHLLVVLEFLGEAEVSERSMICSWIFTFVKFLLTVKDLLILWALLQYFVDRTSLLGVVLVGLEFEDVIF